MKEVNFVFKDETYIIIIGQNKEDNFNIISNSEPENIWFHVDNEPSCHVILKIRMKLNEIPRQVIKRCAYICKINSKSKTKKNHAKG